MTEETAPARDQAGTLAASGIISVQTYPAKTLPGIVGVCLALVGLGLMPAGVSA